MTEDHEKFLSRWSRLKREAREEESAAPPSAPTAPAADPQAPPPELPPVESLTMDSDFRGFLHPEVDENLRRTALRRLFSDPHFNIMDGLDTYIDDYSKPDPLPEGMLGQIRHAQKIIDWAREKKHDAEEEARSDAAVPPARDAALPSAAHATAPPESVPPQAEPQTAVPGETGESGQPRADLKPRSAGA